MSRRCARLWRGSRRRPKRSAPRRRASRRPEPPSRRSLRNAPPKPGSPSSRRTRSGRRMTTPSSRRSPATRPDLPRDPRCPDGGRRPAPSRVFGARSRREAERSPRVSKRGASTSATRSPRFARPSMATSTLAAVLTGGLAGEARGFGAVECARGRLHHVAEIGPGRPDRRLRRRWRRPNGIFIPTALTSQRWPARASATPREHGSMAARLAALVDPCVAFRVRLED